MRLRDISNLVLQVPGGRQGLNQAENQVSRFSHQGCALGDTMNLSAQGLCFSGFGVSLSPFQPAPRKPAFPPTSTPAALVSLFVIVTAVSHLGCIFSSSPLTFQGSSNRVSGDAACPQQSYRRMQQRQTESTPLPRFCQQSQQYAEKASKFCGKSCNSPVKGYVLFLSHAIRSP